MDWVWHPSEWIGAVGGFEDLRVRREIEWRGVKREGGSVDGVTGRDWN
jgi:hypothetical protein